MSGGEDGEGGELDFFCVCEVVEVDFFFWQATIFLKKKSSRWTAITQIRVQLIYGLDRNLFICSPPTDPLPFEKYKFGYMARPHCSVARTLF